MNVPLVIEVEEDLRRCVLPIHHNATSSAFIAKT